MAVAARTGRHEASSAVELVRCSPTLAIGPSSATVITPGRRLTPDLASSASTDGTVEVVDSWFPT